MSLLNVGAAAILDALTDEVNAILDGSGFSGLVLPLRPAPDRFNPANSLWRRRPATTVVGTEVGMA